MTTKTLLIIFSLMTAIVVIAAFVPGIKGPINEIRQDANEYLNDKYIVANCKQKVIEMEKGRQKIMRAIHSLKVQRKNMEYRIKTYKYNKVQLEQVMTKSINNINSFNNAKCLYANVIENLNLCEQSVEDINNNIIKLESMNEKVKNEMYKLNNKVVHLKNKKEIVDALIVTNNIIEDVNGLKITGEDIDVGGSINRLDERFNEEQVRSEVLNETTNTTSTQVDVVSSEEAIAYLESLGIRLH